MCMSKSIRLKLEYTFKIQIFTWLLLVVVFCFLFFFIFLFFLSIVFILTIPISLLSLVSSDDVKKKEKRRNIDQEETGIYTCVFHGLMMHGEAKQNRQQSVFCLTHYMLRGRMRYREKNGVVTCDINISGAV